MKRLIILSDLWGKEKSGWIENYIQYLKEDFDIHYYDCCELGAVDKSDYKKEILHKQFISAGIDTAVQNLTDLEVNRVSVLSFSIGGTIAWKYGIETDRIQSLYCISSTRLRHETVKPKGNLRLYYGDQDKFKPDAEWFDRLLIEAHIFEGQSHEFYKEEEFAKEICQPILTDK